MARASSRSPDHHAPPPPSPLLPGLGRLDTGYCVLKNRLRHIGLATLVSIAQDTDEEDVLRLVAAAPTVYELYWRQDAESTQQRGRYGKCARNCELAWCKKISSCGEIGATTLPCDGGGMRHVMRTKPNCGVTGAYMQRARGCAWRGCGPFSACASMGACACYPVHGWWPRSRVYRGSARVRKKRKKQEKTLG